MGPVFISSSLGGGGISAVTPSKASAFNIGSEIQHKIGQIMIEQLIGELHGRTREQLVAKEGFL